MLDPSQFAAPIPELTPTEIAALPDAQLASMERLAREQTEIALSNLNGWRLREDALYGEILVRRDARLGDREP